jgi:sugar phosphate isomerase/epimerase
MKIGCSSQSLDRLFQKGSMDIPGFMRFAGETLGIPCVELEDKHFAGTSPEYLGSLRAEAERWGVSVASVAFFCSFGFPSKSENDAELERAVQWMQVAEVLRVPRFRTFAGWVGGPDREIGLEGSLVEKPEAAWKTMVGYVRAVCRQARKHGLEVVIENHDNGGFLSSSGDVLRLFSEVREANLSLLLDTGNYVDGLDGIARTVHLVKHHVHLKVKEIRDDGRDARFDLDAILGVVRNSGFSGVISIEYEGTQDELAVLPKLTGWLKRTLGAQRSSAVV